MKRVLLSGAAGFLGSHLARFLLQQGNEVIGVDNLSTGSRSNISDLANNDHFSLIVHDIAESISIDQDIDWVLHLASPASPHDFERMPIQIMKVGGLGTHNMLGIAKAKGARFLLASTSEVYGDPEVHPQPETYWGNVNPLGPRAVYDEAKRYAEALTMAYKRQHNVDVCIARIFNTYGPGMRFNDGRVISSFLTQALTGEPLTIYGEGTQTRSFCYVDDQIDGLVRLAESNQVGPINIGSDHEITIRALASKIIETTGSRSEVVHLPLPEDDPVRRKPDLALASDKLDWNPKVSLEEGLKPTAADLSQQLELM